MSRDDADPQPSVGLGGNRDFMEAVMAVCVLAAGSDEAMQQSELNCIENVVANDPSMQGFDTAKAQSLFNEFATVLRDGRVQGRAKLSEKVLRMAGDPKRARTLMRLAYRIINADHAIEESEKAEFHRLCRILDLDPEFVWRDAAAASSQARDFGVL